MAGSGSKLEVKEEIAKKAQFLVQSGVELSGDGISAIASKTKAVTYTR